MKQSNELKGVKTMKIWISLHEAYEYRARGFVTKRVNLDMRYKTEPITSQLIPLYLYQVTKKVNSHV